MATITVSIDTYRHIMGHCYPDGAFPSAFFFVSVLAGFAPVSLAVCSVSFFSLPLSVLLPLCDFSLVGLRRGDVSEVRQGCLRAGTVLAGPRVPSLGPKRMSGPPRLSGTFRRQSTEDAAFGP